MCFPLTPCTPQRSQHPTPTDATSNRKLDQEGFSFFGGLINDWRNSLPTEAEGNLG